MVKRFRPPLAWVTGLLLASLWLAACGGTVQSTPSSQEQAATNQTTTAATDASCSSAGCAETPTAQTEANATTAATDEVDQAAPATEESVTAKTPAASPTTQVATASKEAICQAIEIPTNAAVSPVSDDDWSKGPANAPITLIEYGDFQ
jgi:hypothetical protein